MATGGEAVEGGAEAGGKPLISEEEVNALLEPGAAGAAQPYDLGGLQRITRGRLPGLEALLDAFTRSFRTALAQLVKREPQLQFQGLQTLKYGDWAAGVPSATCLGPLTLAPLPGQALWHLDVGLASRLVDAFFGGPGKPMARAADKGLTPTEARFAQVLLKQATQDLQQALSPLIGVEAVPGALRASATLSPACLPTDTVTIARFHVELPTGGGLLELVMPATMLEPLREQLVTATPPPPRNGAAGWVDALAGGLTEAAVEVRVVLTQSDLSLGDLVRLKAGDIIPIEPPRTATLYVGDVPVLSGKFGVSRGHHSLMIQAAVRR